jgi:hypothetical protein
MHDAVLILAASLLEETSCSDPGFNTVRIPFSSGEDPSSCLIVALTGISRYGPQSPAVWTRFTFYLTRHNLAMQWSSGIWHRYSGIDAVALLPIGLSVPHGTTSPRV